VLRREADAAERDSRLTEAATAALRDAGLFRLGVPQRFGGYEVFPATFIDVSAEVALACPSSAWVLGVSYGAQVIAGSFGEQARTDLWGDSADTPMCGAFAGLGVTASSADGGLVISGSWPWASGCYQAEWALLGGIPEAGPDGGPGLAVVPLSDLSIKDTWDMAGMRGTGSNTLVADHVFVPEHRLRAAADMVHGNGDPARGPLYKIPVGPLMLTLMGPLLGIGRQVFRLTMDTVGGGKPLASSVYRDLADSPSVQAALADAATLIDSAHLHLARSAQSLNPQDPSQQDPSPLGLLERTRVRMDMGYASKCLREAVQLLLTVNGASSFSRSNVIQRYWRDLETAARHPGLNPGLAREMYGRALVGNQQPVSFLT
jgi:3-hydroxy-9,10-secoandrosta-1,3,5(10)-triene-9,17-dione monooxygenase